VEVRDADAPLEFSPYGNLSTTNALTSAFVDVTFPCAVEREELPSCESGFQAGVSLVYGAAGSSPAFAGGTAQGWVELSAAGVTPAAEVAFRIGVDVKYDSAKSGDPQAVVTRVRYSVDGQVLRDAAGREWLDGAADGMKRVSKISFAGNRGKVGEFSVSRETVPAARARIDVLVVQAKAGTAFSFAGGVVTNEGAVLTGDLAWKWYAGNWRGEYDERSCTSRLTAARCRRRLPSSSGSRSSCRKGGLQYGQ